MPDTAETQLRLEETIMNAVVAALNDGLSFDDIYETLDAIGIGVEMGENLKRVHDANMKAMH